MRYVPRTRLVFLGAVNGLILVHIIAYYVFGRKGLGCIDFFGLATFAGKGQLTAGTLFLAGLFLLTLLFGRVFCGWGCHFAFFQDFLSHTLNRAGIKIPFRRGRTEFIIPPLLVFITLAYPILVWWRTRGAPKKISVDLSYPDLWHLLPGAKGMLLLLLIDVVLLTLLFGGRAFCRFVCPYGLLLKPLHALSPTRVTKVGDCSGCGSCATACPVGVPLKREIETFEVIHDLNCMNCGDCVAACPTGSIALRPTRRAYTRAFERIAIRLKEPFWVDIVLVSSAVVGLFLFRGKDVGDFLAVGMGLICGASVVIAIRPSHLVRLGKKGAKQYVMRTTSGAMAAFLIAGIAAQGVSRYALWEGNRQFKRGDRDAMLRTYAMAVPSVRFLRPAAFYLEDFGRRANHIEEELVTIGDESLLAANWPDAVRAYQSAVELDPTRTAVFGNLGTAYLKSGNFWAAAQNYLRVLETDPNDLVALYHLAVTRIELKEFDDAVGIVERILNIDTEGTAYELIMGNPLFHLLERNPDYRRSMSAYSLLHPSSATKYQGGNP